MSEGVEEGLEVGEHGGVVGEVGSHAPAVAAGGIDVERGGDAVVFESLVVAEAVLGGHGGVVMAEPYPGARGGVGHLTVVAEQYLHGGLEVGAQQVAARAAVGHFGHHGDHRVEKLSLIHI